MGLGVAAGAFGAHALKARFSPYAMSIWEKAVLYHFFHAIGLMIVSILPRLQALAQGSADTICTLLLAGVILFSGSLYALAITGVPTLGAITPVGGVAFLAAWFLLAFRLLQHRP